MIRCENCLGTGFFLYHTQWASLTSLLSSRISSLMPSSFLQSHFSKLWTLNNQYNTTKVRSHLNSQCSCKSSTQLCRTRTFLHFVYAYSNKCLYRLPMGKGELAIPPFAITHTHKINIVDLFTFPATLRTSTMMLSSLLQSHFSK